VPNVPRRHLHRSRALRRYGACTCATGYCGAACPELRLQLPQLCGGALRPNVAAAAYAPAVPPRDATGCAAGAPAACALGYTDPACDAICSGGSSVLAKVPRDVRCGHCSRDPYYDLADCRALFVPALHSTRARATARASPAARTSPNASASPGTRAPTAAVFARAVSQRHALRRACATATARARATQQTPQVSGSARRATLAPPATWEPTATCSALPLRGGDDGAEPVPRPRGPPRHRARRAITTSSATEQQQLQQARRDASERAQPTKPDLFRSCSDVETAAVDREADIPPGLDGDAVES
jgi:hypothetical protein